MRFVNNRKPTKVLEAKTKTFLFTSATLLLLSWRDTLMRSKHCSGFYTNSAVGENPFRHPDICKWVFTPCSRFFVIPLGQAQWTLAHRCRPDTEASSSPPCWVRTLPWATSSSASLLSTEVTVSIEASRKTPQWKSQNTPALVWWTCWSAPSEGGSQTRSQSLEGGSTPRKQENVSFLAVL